MIFAPVCDMQAGRGVLGPGLRATPPPRRQLLLQARSAEQATCATALHRPPVQSSTASWLSPFIPHLQLNPILSTTPNLLPPRQARRMPRSLRTRSSSRPAGAVDSDPVSPEAIRRHLRTILLKVHPDRFSSHKAEQVSNSESLKQLNVYLDHIAERRRVNPLSLDFFIKEEHASSCEVVSVTLPGKGGLGPLFHAFGLISDEELVVMGTRIGDSGQPREGMGDLVNWLAENMAEVSRTRQEYCKQEAELNTLRFAIEQRFHLDYVDFDTCWYNMTVPELQRRMEQLEALQASLHRLSDTGASFHGLKICLRDMYDQKFEEGQRVHMDPVDGSISLLAGSDTLDEELASLDPSNARSLAMESQRFDDTVKEQLAEAARLLGVGHISCPLGEDSDDSQGGHKSLAWIQRLLHQDRQMVEKAMAGCRTPHLSSLILGVDSNEFDLPFVSPDLPTWLCVSNSSSTQDLIDFLCSEEGSRAAAGAHERRLSEQADSELCERVCEALGCRSVSTDSSGADYGAPWHSWRRAAHLLLDNSQLLRSSVDLSSIVLLFGESYEIWAELGMITIPCDFEVEDLPRQLRRLMEPQPAQ